MQIAAAEGIFRSCEAPPIYARHARPIQRARQRMTTTLETEFAIEKTPLERYVPPAKPSLVGLTRAALADALGAIGVPEAGWERTGEALAVVRRERHQRGELLLK